MNLLDQIYQNEHVHVVEQTYTATTRTWACCIKFYVPALSQGAGVRRTTLHYRGADRDEPLLRAFKEMCATVQRLQHPSVKPV